jgi:hypothetical protein
MRRSPRVVTQHDAALIESLRNRDLVVEKKHASVSRPKDPDGRLTGMEVVIDDGHLNPYGDVSYLTTRKVASLRSDTRSDVVRKSAEFVVGQYTLVAAEQRAPVFIREPHTSPRPFTLIARDDVKMDLPVLVHEEGMVEQVGREQRVECRTQPADLSVQFDPLVGGHVGHGRTRTTEDEHRLSQEILIAVQRNDPRVARLDHRRRIQGDS